MLSPSIWAYRLLFVLFIPFDILFLYATENPSYPNELTPIYPPKKLPLLEEKSPTPQHFSKLVNNKKNLNLNIASYYLNVLASPDESTWSTTGGPINKTIKHLGLTRHHWKTVERTWHMVNKCKEMKQEYTGNNYTRHLGQPYLLSNPDELNILEDEMEKKCGLRYTTHIINCHCHHKGFNEVCKSTVNLAFLILQPKRTRIQKILQGTMHEGKWKEARQCKNNNGWLWSTYFQRINSKYISKWQKNVMQKQRYQLDLFHLLHIIR